MILNIAYDVICYVRYESITSYTISYTTSYTISLSLFLCCMWTGSVRAPSSAHFCRRSTGRHLHCLEHWWWKRLSRPWVQSTEPNGSLPGISWSSGAFYGRSSKLGWLWEARSERRAPRTSCSSFLPSSTWNFASGSRYNIYIYRIKNNI